MDICADDAWHDLYVDMSFHKRRQESGRFEIKEMDRRLRVTRALGRLQCPPWLPPATRRKFDRLGEVPIGPAVDERTPSERAVTRGPAARATLT